MSPKVLFIFGTRPEAIKMAPLIKVFRSSKNGFNSVVTVTAQHREMLDQVLTLFDITPDYDLNLMTANQNLSSLTAKIIVELTNVLENERPDLVIVQGDTTSTFIGSLAAFYLQIPVAHIEAGLRTGNKFSPFPEEINRNLTSCLTDFHFAPTIKAKQNLLNEGIPDSKIYVTGNTVIDALILTVEKQKDKDIQKKWQNFFHREFDIYLDKGTKTILVTGHRRESFGSGFKNICTALSCLARRHPEIQIIYPVHLNPNVQEPVYSILGGIHNIHLIDPLDYEPFVYLMNKSYLILTDSGGIQEEAPSLGKPVLVMRKNTERPEGIDAGTAKLVGTNVDTIINEVETLLFNKEVYHQMSKAVNPYGNGKAAKKIFNHIKACI